MDVQENEHKRESDMIEHGGVLYKLISVRFSTATYSNKENNRLIKLLFPYDDINDPSYRQKFNNEIKCQELAANANLGPEIYAAGLYKQNENTNEHGMKTYTGTSILNLKKFEYAPNTTFDYIVMEYYNPNKWKNPVFISSENKDIFIQFISDLVIIANVVNKKDPLDHFYYNETEGLKMIDYGRCEECNGDDAYKKECIIFMLDDIGYRTLCTINMTTQPLNMTTQPLNMTYEEVRTFIDDRINKEVDEAIKISKEKKTKYTPVSGSPKTRKKPTKPGNNKTQKLKRIQNKSKGIQKPKSLKNPKKYQYALV
jgi:hypothetical protein